MEPIRSCVGCRKRKNKKDLLRIVMDDNGNLLLDKLQKINKRGIYVCNDINCINKVIKYIEKGKLRIKPDMSKEKLKDLLNNIIIELGE